MSIKVVHVIFVVSTTLMAASSAYWAHEVARNMQRTDLQTLAVALTVLAVAMPIYGWWFYRKLKKNPSL